jgi:hypothetical protein
MGILILKYNYFKIEMFLSIDVGIKNFAMIKIKNKELVDVVLLNFTENYLEDSLDYIVSLDFSEISLILIEQQMFNNKKMLLFQQHIVAILQTIKKIKNYNYNVICINPKKKIKYFREKYNNINENNNKKFVTKLLYDGNFQKKYNITKQLSYISSFKKKDDIADAILQCYFYLDTAFS